MKKLSYLLLILAGVLLVMIQANMPIAQKVLQPVIEYRCGQALNASRIWKIGTYFVSEPKQAQLQQDVCGCVGEHALKDVPAKTLLKATVNEELKSELTKQAMSKSLNGCMRQFLK